MTEYQRGLHDAAEIAREWGDENYLMAMDRMMSGPTEVSHAAAVALAEAATLEAEKHDHIGRVAHLIAQAILLRSVVV